MIQGILAIILLVLAMALFFWGRRSPKMATPENPDAVLGLKENSEENLISEPQAPVEMIPPPVSPKIPLQREIIFIKAPAGRPFSGYELLQSLLSCGLRFGDKRIFHRYEQNSEAETEVFSVAAATHTGELNPAEMGEFTCLGLSLFLTLNKHVYPSVNFEMMLDTARQLAEDLGGVLLDECQELLTPEKIKKLREKIKQFETSQQNMELFV
jgi:cell division protein ZipA